VEDAVIAGFKPFAKEIGARGVSHDDVEHLLRIPIRRISLYDINKAREEVREILDRIKVINGHLKNIVAYAVSYIDGIAARIKASEDLGRGKRRTEVLSFDKVDIKEVVKKDLELKYDSATGYLGTAVAAEVVAEVSPFDRILVLKKDGSWSVVNLPDKSFVGPGAWWIGVADKEVLSSIVFTVIYKDKEKSYPYIKRCVIEGWIMNRDYSLVPEGAEVLHVDTRDKFNFTVRYSPKPRLKVLSESFKAQDYPVRGLKAGGIKLSGKETAGVSVK
jgi:topoisomerase-4 subunit A